MSVSLTMNKEQNRERYPDITHLVDEIREHMSLGGIEFPYEVEPCPVREQRMMEPFCDDPKDKR